MPTLPTLRGEVQGVEDALNVIQQVTIGAGPVDEEEVVAALTGDGAGEPGFVGFEFQAGLGFDEILVGGGFELKLRGAMSARGVVPMAAKMRIWSSIAVVVSPASSGSGRGQRQTYTRMRGRVSRAMARIGSSSRRAQVASGGTERRECPGVITIRQGDGTCRGAGE